MFRFRFVLGLFLMFVTTLAAQGPAFEVASIKPSDPSIARVALGIHIDGSYARMAGMSLRQYVGLAYRLEPHQIIGPDWLGETHFDISAKIPEGVSPGLVPEMLQALLAERFKVVLHRESKEFAVHALMVGKDGLKMRPVPPDEPSGEKPKALEVSAGGGPDGAAGSLGHGASFRLTSNRLEMRKLSMPALARLLTRLSMRPVVDATGVDGVFDLDIDLAEEDFTPILIRAAVNAGRVLPPQALRMLDGAASDPFSIGMQKFGLKLESARRPLDVLVIDSASMMPTEN